MTASLRAENVILFIGDGMGFEHVKAARCYNGASLSFEALPHQAQVTTYSANNSVTDSAASGTAIATGVKVNNYVVSLAVPGDGLELQTSLEFYKKRGKKVGLVTTTYLTHATPATFGAHETDRNNTEQIAGDYLNQTRPNILFGGGGNGLTPSATAAAGYAVATDSASFAALSLSSEHLSAQFGTSFLPYEFDYLTGTYPYPHLAEMVAKALEVFESHPGGFFLIVEGGMIDQAGHANDLPRTIHETLELSRAVQVAMNWAANRTDTLILVTADHETGGLQVTQDKGTGVYPTVTWSTTGHTGVNVPAYGWGPGAERVSGVLDNTDLYRISTGQPIPVSTTLVAAGATWKYEASGTDLGTAWRERDYDDSGWFAGAAKLGYGDGDEATVIPITSPVYPCYYFRHTFNVDDPAAYNDLSLRILRDDGAVVYLNGTEVARYNMPDGDVSYDTWSSTAADYPWDAAVALPNLLVAGPNVVAVEVHQFNSTSSDLALDLELKAARVSPDTTPPVITDVQVVVSDETAVISWTTDEPADSQVAYADPWVTVGDPLFVTQHSILLSGLTSATPYAYQVRSTDAAGNASISAVGEFTTLEFINDPPSAPVLTATGGDATVALAWTASTDPEGGLVKYAIYRRLATDPYGEPLAADLYETSYSDTTVQNGTAYYYTIRASDLELFADSAELGVIPAAPDYTAYVVQEPTVTYGTLTGSYLTLRPEDPGVQTLTEAKVALNGVLDAEYLLQTTADLSQVTAATLRLDGTYTDYSDPLIIWLWTGADWSDITASLVDGVCSLPIASLDANGVIRVRFTDSVTARKEKLDVLTLDSLYAEITIGNSDPPQNQAPVAGDDTAITSFNTPVTINVLANDSDPDGDALSSTITTSPGFGTITVASDQSVTYVPNFDFSGTDTFTYEISDGQGGTATATVTVAVSPPSGEATVHVQSITLTATPAGKNWKALAAVLITDQNGAAAGSASVYGDWWFNNNPIQTGAMAITDLTGTAQLSSPTVKTSGGTFTFRVTDVLLPGHTFQPGAADAAAISVP